METGCVFLSLSLPLTLSLAQSLSRPLLSLCRSRRCCSRRVYIIYIHIYTCYYYYCVIYGRRHPRHSRRPSWRQRHSIWAHTYNNILCVRVCARVLCTRNPVWWQCVCVRVSRIEEAVVCGDGDDYKMPTDWSQERPFYAWMCVYGYLYRTHTDPSVCMCVSVCRSVYMCICGREIVAHNTSSGPKKSNVRVVCTEEG